MLVTDEVCNRCGLDPAQGFAEIDGKRYCHEGTEPTCNMREKQTRIAEEESLVFRVVNRPNQHLRITSVS